MTLALLFVWSGVALAAWVGRRRPFREPAPGRRAALVAGPAWGLMRD